MYSEIGNTLVREYNFIEYKTKSCEIVIFVLGRNNMPYRSQEPQKLRQQNSSLAASTLALCLGPN